MSRRTLAEAAALAAFVLANAACRDVSDFTTRPDEHFEGPVVAGSFVRSGVAADVTMCLTLDTSRLQSTPGTLTTSDGRFRDTPLRSIPQLWHDPLSTLGFGAGRVQNMVYVATAADDAGASDAMVVVSLMQSGSVEVRMMRSAPQADAAPPPPGAPAPLFGIWNLVRHEGACPL
jgi:hypothetical protein